MSGRHPDGDLSELQEPHNLEAEEYVLGAMMLTPCPVAAVTAAVDADDFYRESHGMIYRAEVALFEAGTPLDAITVCDALEKRGELERVGGKERIREIAS